MFQALARHLTAWLRIGASDQVLTWITQSVKLQFTSEPPRCKIPNKQFNDRDTAFINQEIAHLVSIGAVKRVNYIPHCVSPLGVVPKKNNKKRLICDLRHVNEHVYTPYFKNENIESVAPNIKYGDRCVQFDLNNGYFHIPTTSIWGFNGMGSIWPRQQRILF